MIDLQTDIRVNFDSIGIRFQEMLNDRHGELLKITKQAIESFDFEQALKFNIYQCINKSIERAFEKFDFSQQFEDDIREIIENRIKFKGEREGE